MMKSNITSSAISELIQAMSQKEQYLRGLGDSNYQGNRLINLMEAHKHSLLFYQWVLQQDAARSRMFNTLIQKQKNHKESFLGLLHSNRELFHEESKFVLSHKSMHPQSLMLAIYLSKEFKSKINLVTCDSSLRGLGHLISQENQADRLGFVKEVAGKEGVNIHDINSWKQDIQIKKEQFVILDLFRLNPIEYRPFLINFERQLTQCPKIFVYHSHLQDQEVAIQLESLEQKSLAEAIPIQLLSEHPIEKIVEDDERTMLDRLLSFLQEEKQKPQKQDVVIFTPADIHIRKFTVKIKQEISRNHLRQSVNIVSTPHDAQITTKNNLFLVRNVEQLLSWDLNLSSLFIVLDYEKDETLGFDYERGMYIRRIGRCSGAEKARRMSLAGSTNIGRYVSLSSEVGVNGHYIDIAFQLTNYVIKMIYFGLGHKLEHDKKRIVECIKLLSNLQLAKKQGDKLMLVDNTIVKLAQAGVNAIDAKMILDILNDKTLKTDDQVRLANLMPFAVEVSKGHPNLRKELFGAEFHLRKKVDSLWKRAGYIESCLDIFTKCEAIEFNNKAIEQGTSSPEIEIIKRMSSRISDEEANFFSCMFALCEDTPTTKQMDVSTFLKHNEVNQYIFYDLRSNVEHIRQLLNIATVNIILEPADVNNILARFINKFPQRLAYYSGHKRIGYKFNNSQITAKLGTDTLLAKSGEHPQYLLVTSLTYFNGEYHIQECNSISEETLLDIMGHLPVKKMESYGQAQLEFHGLSSATFQELRLNKNSLIATFEEQNDCTLDLKPELDLIILHCSRTRADKTKANFQHLLDRIKERISSEKKLIHLLGNTSITMQIGGQIEDIIKDKHIDKCLLSNIDLEATKEDLEEIFQEFFVLKSITLHPVGKEKQYQTATIHFYSQKDYYRFYQYYHGCEFYSRKFIVEPIHGPEQISNPFGSERYIIFKWFVWQSCCKGLIKFENQSSVSKAVEAFKNNPKLDDAQVILKAEGNEVIIENLNHQTDEIYLRSAMQGYGRIVSIELMKYPLAEQSNPDLTIESLIKKAKNNNNNFNMQQIKRLPDGLRTCKVNFDFTQDIRNVVKQYNMKKGLIGQGRLYAISKFQKHVLIPPSLAPLYKQILDDYVEESHMANVVTVHYRKHNQSQYVLFEGQEEAAAQNAHRGYLACLNPQTIPLNNTEKNMVFNDLGLSSILFVEEQYSCKLVIDLVQKNISFIAPKNIVKRIRDVIKDRLINNFYYMLTLSSKTYKHLKANKDILKEMKKEHKLSNVELQVDSYAVLISGPINHVQPAVAYLMHISQSLLMKGDEMKNPDVCGICCNKYNQPYRLQQCGHMFCSPCLVQYFRTILKNVSLFPVKCPQCSQLVVLRDLETNLNRHDFQILKNLALNKFVNTSNNKYKFCPTGGCKQINIVQGPIFMCQTCKIEYCNLCNQTSHRGIRCEDVLQVRQSDQFFKKYMKEHGGRFCPNPACKMPVVKIDGCDKVHCTRCDMSMCFKCPPDNMKYYQDEQDCYNHLDEVHGGYY